MRLSVQHTTRYTYEEAAHYALIQLRMRPKNNPSQTVIAWQLDLSGAYHHLGFTDQYGTSVDLIELEPGANTVEIHVQGDIETSGQTGLASPDIGTLPLWCYLKSSPLTRSNPPIEQLAVSIQDDDNISRLHALAREVKDSVVYTAGVTDAKTRAEDALALGQGVCQDHSHIFLSAARHLGFPSRYVSGYLMMNDRIDQDASHAWAEVYLDGLGWVGFDISNGISPDERYVKIAHGLDYTDCSPTRGILIGAVREQLEVSIQVQQ